MSATANADLVKCSICEQMTAPIYIAQRSRVSATFRKCKDREEEERKSKRRQSVGPRGLLGFILPGLMLGCAALRYFNVDVPGVDKGKALFAHLFDSTSDDGAGSHAGPEKNPPAEALPRLNFSKHRQHHRRSRLADPHPESPQRRALRIWQLHPQGCSQQCAEGRRESHPRAPARRRRHPRLYG